MFVGWASVRCGKYVWSVSEGCLEGMERLTVRCGGCLEGVRRLSGGCRKAVWRVSEGCLVGVERMSGGGG